MLCLSGFELYSRWVPLTALDFVLFELLLLNIIEMTMIFHTLRYFRLLSVYSIKTCLTIGINDIVASRTTTSHVFHQSSLNLTETVYEKLEKHTLSREVRLLKQITPHESTSKEISFEWSHQRILSTDVKEPPHKLHHPLWQ